MSNQEDGSVLEFKYFLILDGLVVLGILIWLFMKPKGPQLRLKMTGGKKAAGQGPLGAGEPSAAKISGKQDTTPAKQKPEMDFAPPSEGRTLTILFMFNGHSFEAYETLGLPAGSSLEASEEAYRNIALSGKESQEFIRAAIETIRKSHR